MFSKQLQTVLGWISKVLSWFFKKFEGVQGPNCSVYLKKCQGSFRVFWGSLRGFQSYLEVQT